jgi:aryl-alcohol dehydrogenase-like predicted oxidoreductase
LKHHNFLSADRYGGGYYGISKARKNRIKVSAIGIGGEGFENKGYEECEALIDCAIKEGINFIDIYNSNPEVRSNVGKALSKYPRTSCKRVHKMWAMYEKLSIWCRDY